MKPEVLKALEQSVERWRCLSTATSLDDVALGVSECALCALFFEYDCSGCPVSENTGQEYCSGTPYIYADFSSRSGDLEGFKSAAVEEVEFLQSLVVEAHREA